MKRINLHIECLSLRGFRYADRHEIAEGLETELGRLLADPTALRNMSVEGNAARLAIPSFNVALGSKPREIGIAAARSIGQRRRP